MPPVEIPLRNDFDSGTGQFPNYDAYDLAQRDALLDQKHTDIRSFYNDTTDLITTQLSMLNLDTKSMTDLDAMMMSDLLGQITLRTGEGWTVGTVGKQADRNNWHGLSLSCGVGTTTTLSVIGSVDISDFASTDSISLGLPDLPLTSLTTSSCFIDFTSNATGDFTAGPTDSIAFSTSTQALVAGDCELRFPISSLATIDKSAITGVRLRIVATGICTFRAMALRAISANWKYAPTDLNTLYDQAERPAPSKGSLTQVSAFPTATPPITPLEWPVLYRATDPPSSNDPRPINANTSTAFNTGSLKAASGDVDYAVLLNGTSGYVEIPDDNLLDVGDVFSLGIWLKRTSLSADTIFSKGANNWKVEFTGGNAFKLSKKGVGDVVTSTATITDTTTLHFLMVTKNGATTKLYLDGVDVTGIVTNQTMVSNASNMQIGVDSGAGFLHALIDEAVIYPTALSATRVKQLYNTAKFLPGNYKAEVLADVPVGYWRMADAAVTAIDSSGNSLHGSYVGGFTRNQVGALTLDTNTNSTSTLALYFRELPLDAQDQLDLNGMDQAELAASGKQPDFDRAKYTYRTQQDLDIYPQMTLDEQTQFNLERIEDYLSSTYLCVQLDFNAVASKLTIKDTVGTSYIFDNIALLPNTNYILFTDVEEESVRARIYKLDSRGKIIKAPIVLDTTVINDPVFHRHKGRFGWYAKFLDGDTSLDNIRTRKLNFAEYRSLPLRSNTPVKGARLYAGSSPDRELFNGMSASPWGGLIELDSVKSSSGESFRITSVGNQPLQGIQTNSMYLDNMDDTEIAFSILSPSGILGSDGLACFLYGELSFVAELPLPPLKSDQWQRIKINLSTVSAIQSGNYRLMIVQSKGNLPTSWYLDGLSISSRTVRWEGRGNPQDAWSMSGTQWLPFEDTINRDYGGILFRERGTGPQVRGLARTQDANIRGLKIVPEYAQLSRLVWKDEQADPGAKPIPNFVPTFTYGGVAQRVQYDASASTVATDKFPIAYYWTYGDGTFDYGRTVLHTYEQSGTYTVTLTVIDNLNQRAALTQTVVV